MADVAMPRLSDSMEEGTILKWLKSDGDEIKRGEELVEIETDKANMTYEADQEGVLAIVAQEGDTLPVGAVIARIGAAASNGASADVPAETPAQGVPAETPALQEVPVKAPASQDVPAEAPEGDGAPVKASPVARRMAREFGVS